MRTITINDIVKIETNGYVQRFIFSDSNAMQEATTTDVILAELLKEQRKTNDLLEELGRNMRTLLPI